MMDRRAFMARGAAVAAGTIATPLALDRLTVRAALARRRARPAYGYGPPERMPDQHGRHVLALPAGFSYVTFGDIGAPMSDGHPTPLALDGMAAFPGPGGSVRLIRTHEDRNEPGQGSVHGAARYDPLAGGGTTTLDYDARTRTLVRDFVSLAGSHVNCAGGYGLGRRSWLTGEETIAGPENSGFARRHGYLFEVPRDRGPGDTTPPVPLVAMGRFSHEAAATDDRTGNVYETEDPGSGRGAGSYRFIPDDPDDLGDGGRLQMLGIRGRPQYDARQRQRPNRGLPVVWIDIEDPDPDYEDDDDPRGVFEQGRRRGGAMFNRLEGCWYDGGSVYFVSTSGGDVKNGDVNSDGFPEGYGQIWEYRPAGRSGGVLRLHYESPGAEALDSPDNLTVTPRGGLIVCEDDASSDSDLDPRAPGIEDVNRLVGFTRQGEAFVFAVNVLSGSELAGVCFSPDGSTRFVNVYGDSSGTTAEHARRGHDLRDHRPLERGAAVSGSGGRSQPAGRRARGPRQPTWSAP